MAPTNLVHGCKITEFALVSLVVVGPLDMRPQVGLALALVITLIAFVPDNEK